MCQYNFILYILLFLYYRILFYSTAFIDNFTKQLYYYMQLLNIVEIFAL